MKRSLRMQDDNTVPTDVLHELKCSVCGCFLLSMTGLVNHLKSHGQRPNEAVYEEAVPARPIKHSCPTCMYVCMYVFIYLCMHVCVYVCVRTKICRDTLRNSGP